MKEGKGKAGQTLLEYLLLQWLYNRKTGIVVRRMGGNTIAEGTGKVDTQNLLVATPKLQTIGGAI